jgi:hypothetical protein
LTYLSGYLRRTLVVNKTLHKVRQGYYELNLTRSYTEKRWHLCDTCAASAE